VVFSPPPESSGVEIVRDLKPLSLEMNRAVLEPLPQAGVQMSFEREAPLVQRAFEFSASEVSRFEFLSSIDDTYLMVRKGASVYLFDQHALHERILYERLLKEFQQGHCISSQRLLFPIPVLIENAEALMESEEVLEKLGFELRLWNDGKLQVVAAPSILKRDHQLVLQKLSESKELPLETLVRDVLASMACHSAVRAHDKIERPEIERLLRDFESEDALGHCPHGRPTYVEFRVKDLEKLFQRVN
jgi:DNA mismatch repair protein MutL